MIRRGTLPAPARPWSLPASAPLRHKGTWRGLIITVRQGSVGSAVRAVQGQLNFSNKNGHILTVDGIFGPKTAAAVPTFSGAMAHEVPGFVVDGIAGPQAWQALVTETLPG